MVKYFVSHSYSYCEDSHLYSISEYTKPITRGAFTGTIYADGGSDYINYNCYVGTYASCKVYITIMMKYWNDEVSYQEVQKMLKDLL